MRTILPLVVVCFLSVTLVSGYRLHERLDRGPFNPLQARWELPHRRGDCKEKGEVCSSSSECCNTGCAYKDQAKTERYQCQICSSYAGEKTCYYPWVKPEYLETWKHGVYRFSSLVELSSLCLRRLLLFLCVLLYIMLNKLKCKMRWIARLCSFTIYYFTDASSVPVQWRWNHRDQVCRLQLNNKTTLKSLYTLYIFMPICFLSNLTVRIKGSRSLFHEGDQNSTLLWSEISTGAPKDWLLSVKYWSIRRNQHCLELPIT